MAPEKGKYPRAVSVVKAEDLVVTKNENVVNMLAGKVPGLLVQQMSEPGSFTPNSISADLQQLYRQSPRRP